MIVTAIINGTDTIQLVDFTASDFIINPSLKIQSTDLNYIKNLFTDLETLEIYYGDVKIGEYTEYDGFSSIQYMGNVFSNSEQRFVECMQVNLTKASLVEQVNRIEQKIDGTIDFDAMSVEEYKEYLLKDISAKGEAQIFAGTGVILSDGSSRVFTYNLEDQSNLDSAIFIAEKLDDPDMSFPYHSHNAPCELFPVSDIITIYMTLRMMSIQVQTRVNLLMSYIRTINTKAELMEITYLTPLPLEYQETYDEIITACMEIMAELQEKYLPQDDEEPIDDGEEVIDDDNNEEPETID